MVSMFGTVKEVEKTVKVHTHDELFTFYSEGQKINIKREGDANFAGQISFTPSELVRLADTIKQQFPDFNWEAIEGSK